MPPGWLTDEEYERGQNNAVRLQGRNPGESITDSNSQQDRQQPHQQEPQQQEPLSKPAFTMLALCQMGVGKLKAILKENEVVYNPRELVDKEDLIRILFRSQTIPILPDNINAQRGITMARGDCQGPFQPMPRRDSQGPIHYLFRN